MIRNATKIAALAALLVLATTGCKKKNVEDKAPTETAMETREMVEPEESSGKEVAEGDIRDAILALQRVHFGFDSSDLTEESRAALNEAGSKLSNKPDVHLYVEGHADSAGETEYNMTLGEKRAKAVSDYLAKLGVASERLHIVSYGEEMPLAKGSSSQAMAENRRVDFKVMRGDVELVLEDSATIN